MKRFMIPVLFGLLFILTLFACDEAEVDYGLTFIPDGDADVVSEQIETSEEEEISESEEQEEIELPDYELPDEPTARIPFEIWGPTTSTKRTPYNRLPFPYDFFSKEDESSLTGRRVNLHELPAYGMDYVNTNMIDRGLFLLNMRYVDAINTKDGFSPFGYMFFEVEPDLDESLLPQTLEESVSDESLIQLVRISEGHPAFGERVEIIVEKREAVEWGEGGRDDPIHDYWYVSARPATPLDEQSHYALIVKKGLKTPEGVALESSVHFQLITGLLEGGEDLPSYDLIAAEKARMASVFASLASDEIGVEKSELLLAFDFTTQSITTDLASIERRYKAGELEPVNPNFDEITYASEKKAPRYDWSAIGMVAHGLLPATDFRLPVQVEWNENRRRAFDYDDNQEPIAQNVADIPFLLMLPKDPAAQPAPVVFVQHGIGSNKNEMRRFGDIFCKLGWAVISADFPYHGEREEGYAPLAFVDIPYPLKANAAFKQSVADHMQLIRMVQQWEDDIYPEGGDGIADISGERIGYLGNSLGAIVGGVTIGASSDLGAAALAVGGGGLMDYVSDFMAQYGISTLFPDHYMKQFSTIAQTILDSGDSVNYGAKAVSSVDGAVEKSIFTLQAIVDDTVPASVTENFVRAAGLPHIRPVMKDVWGLEQVDAPVSRFGHYQYMPSSHSLVFNSGEDGQGARAQLNHFFETFFQTGTGEIIDPKAEER